MESYGFAMGSSSGPGTDLGINVVKNPFRLCEVSRKKAWRQQEHLALTQGPANTHLSGSRLRDVEDSHRAGGETGERNLSC